MTRRRSAARLLAGGLASLALAAGLGVGCGGRDEPREIRIGVVAPIEEDSEVNWRPLEDGIHVVEEEVRRQGGLRIGERSYPVVFVFASNGDSPEGTVAAARRLIHHDGVVALVGPIMSRNAVVMAMVAENEGVPMISATASHPAVFAGKRFAFSLAASDEVLGRALARLAHGDLGATTGAALFDVASSYNRGLAEAFRDELSALGGAVVAFETYVTGERDFRPQLSRIRDADPDVVLLPNYMAEVPVQARQARELGIRATLLGGDSWDESLFADVPELDGSYFILNWHPGIEPERSRHFVEICADLGLDPSEGAALTYDAAGLVLEAIRRTGSLDGETLQQGLREIEGFRGVTGTVSLRGPGEPIRDLAILRLTRGEVEFRGRTRTGPSRRASERHHP